MKTALVLSGGGAKGAFQAGALEELAGREVVYHSIAGVSVGALNGVMVAAGKEPRLIEIWKTIRQDQVYKKRSVLGLLSKFGLYKIGIAKPPKSIYSNKPLFELLQKELQSIELEIPVTIGRVNLETGVYFDEINSLMPDFAATILASTAIPVVWAPVKINGDMFVDGGVRNMTPLADAVKTRPERIIVITTAPVSGLKEKTGLRDIVDIAERTLDILLNEIFIEDLKRCIQINNLVKQAAKQGITLSSESGEPYKQFKMLVIAPPEPIGSSLDFERKRLDQLFALGKETARKVLG